MGLTSKDPRSHDESGKQTLGKGGTKTSKEVRRHFETGRISMVSKVKRRMGQVRGSKHQNFTMRLQP